MSGAFTFISQIHFNMKIALFGTPFSDSKTKYVQHLVNKLENDKVSLTIEKEFHKCLNDIKFKYTYSIFDSHVELVDKADILLSIGGDGTLLASATFVRDSNIPILGINTGTLGFISSVSTDQIEYAVNHLLKGEYAINERTLLELKSSNQLFGDVNFALNEVTVLKKDTSSMIRIHAYLDDEFINTYWADGLIISSPTGSTGYSLSCGGPIVIPGTNNFIITPIAPHNLNVRPIIVSDQSKITLKVSERDDLALVTLDSRSRAIGPGLELTIQKADYNINLIQFDKQSFISTIREKLMWGKDKRN